MAYGGGKIGGISFDSLNLTLTKVNMPILPSTIQIEEEIPGMDGTVDMETRYGPRTVELTFDLFAGDETEYQVKLADIAEAFNPINGTKELVLDRMPGKRWLVKYNGTIPVEKLATIGTFTIPLKAFYPFAESVVVAGEMMTLDDSITQGMGLTLENSQVTFNITASPTTYTVYQAGNHVARPVIKITGTGGNIAVTNDTTQEGFSVGLTLTSGDELVIDCAKKTVKLNGNNAFSSFSGVFPKLIEGDNMFTITADNPNLTIEHVFRHTYLY